MSEPARHALEAFAVFFFFCGGGLYMAVTQARLLDRLRIRHPDVWNAMGRPSMFPAGGFDAWMKAREGERRAFLMVVRGGYRELNDPVLSRICLQLRIVFGVFLFVFAGFAITTMIAQISAPHR